ncbi:NUDIX domain-containing protein [Diplocarpon rosae]|nr:NUDIX domain-containing protein [Diplocarpon rosae]
MPPRPELEKQYMSSSTSLSKKIAEPRPSARDGGALLEIGEGEREWGRKAVHGKRVGFEDWVKGLGGVVDIENLYPFTRWITPTNLPKRFTTQMYIYFLPLSHPSLPPSVAIPLPTSDGGLEHTAALFAPCSAWLAQARANSIILFPPQYYLMHLLSPFLSPLIPSSSSFSYTHTHTHTELQSQRDAVLRFLLGDGGDGKGISWRNKVMSPMGLLMRKSDGRSVLALDKPGPELKGSGRGGDWERVVLVRFGKEGPRDVEIRGRAEVLEEEKRRLKL